MNCHFLLCVLFNLCSFTGTYWNPHVTDPLFHQRQCSPRSPIKHEWMNESPFDSFRLFFSFSAISSYLQRSCPAHKKAPRRGLRRPWGHICHRCDMGSTWQTPWPDQAVGNNPSWEFHCEAQMEIKQLQTHFEIFPLNNRLIFHTE